MPRSNFWSLREITHPGEEVVTVQVKRAFLGMKGKARGQRTQRGWGPRHSQAHSYRGVVRQWGLDGEQSLQVGLAPATTKSAVNARQGQTHGCVCGEGHKGPELGTHPKFWRGNFNPVKGLTHGFHYICQNSGFLWGHLGSPWGWWGVKVGRILSPPLNISGYIATLASYICWGSM